MNAKRPPAELIARAKAYSAYAAAYEADPAQPLFLEQVRRDVDATHRWLAKQEKRSC